MKVGLPALRAADPGGAALFPRRLRWGRAAFCLAGANYNQIRARPRWGRLVPHPPLGAGRMPSLGRG